MTARSQRTELSVRRVIGTLVMSWLCTTVAAAAFWPVYESGRFVIMVVATTLVGSVIALLGAVYRIPIPIVGVLTVVAYLVVGVPLAVPDGAAFGVLPTWDGLRALLAGTALSWKQLLTISLPVGSYQALLVPPFAIILVSVTVSLSLALRSRVAELAVVGPIALFVAGIVFGSTAGFQPLVTSIALAGAVLAWLVVMRRGARGMAAGESSSSRSGRVRPGRSIGSAALIVTIALLGSFAAATALPPSSDRQVLRSSVEQPFDPREYASPLSAFRRYHQEASADATMLTVRGLPADTRVRIATLDTYDGTVYAVGGENGSSSSGTFTLLPGDVDRPGSTGRRASLEITVGDYRGVWLPTVGLLSAVDFDGEDAGRLRESFYYNESTDSAAVIGGLREGDTYSLEIVIPQAVDDTALARMSPGTVAVPGAADLPDELSVALDRYTGSVDGPGARLVAALDGMRREGYISHGVSPDEPRSRSGHSADRITELFASPQMIGDAEQYAVAGALMARELGFPSRVVLGFAPGTSADSGETIVTGSEISAWIEVDTAQSGWVALDPVPAVREIPEAQAEEPTRVARPQAPVQPPPDEPQTPDDQAPPDSTQNDAPPVDQLLAIILLVFGIVGWVLLGSAIVLSPFIAILALKYRRRRRRRHAASAVDQISGGWSEYEDAVVDHGLAPPRSATRSEFAELVGGRQPLILAAAADRAVFSPEGPDLGEAEIVWEVVDDLTTALDRGLTWRARLRARLSVRSLRTSDSAAVRVERHAMAPGRGPGEGSPLPDSSRTIRRSDAGERQ